MESFISIISIQTNSLTNENVVVGLVAVSGKSIYFNYSTKKLSLAQKVSGSQALVTLCQNALVKIDKQVKNANKNQASLFSNSHFNISYFEYLNQYSAGAVKFSIPFQIKKKIDQVMFSDYYRKFVGEKLIKKVENYSFKTSVKKYLDKEGLNEKADIAYKLNPDTYKGIFSEATLPLITKNGSVTAVQLVDFSASKDVCAKNLYLSTNVFYSLDSFCKQRLNTTMGRMKIVFEEPDLKSESHKVFELAKKESTDIFEFIHKEELDDFTNQILDSNYVTFSSLIKGG